MTTATKLNFDIIMLVVLLKLERIISFLLHDIPVKQWTVYLKYYFAVVKGISFCIKEGTKLCKS
jgi:hypothetical protein